MANFNRAPYYDDFDENKKFLQILFQPGRPVQARELTQLQSILQNQIERGGSHIFKHGSKVFSPEIIGGEANYDNNGGVKFIKIAPNDKNGTAVDVSNFVGKRIKDGGISGVDVEPINGSGIVVSASANVAGDAATLFVRWDGPLASLPIDTVLQTFDPSGVTTSYYTANVISTDADYVGDSSIYETSRAFTL